MRRAILSLGMLLSFAGIMNAQIGVVSMGRGVFDGAIASPPAATPMSFTQSHTQIQILSNGVRIRNRSVMKCWIDSDGRTRDEMYEDRDGELRLTSISIQDPVAKRTYTLDPRRRLAQFTTYGNGPRYIESPSQEAFLKASLVDREAQLQEQERRQPVNKQEDLGTQTILGVTAHGERTTTTIPAGAIGNDSDIKSVWESWTDERLQLQLRMTSDDPRSGQSIQEITELRMGPPDPALFKPPPNYQIFDLTPTFAPPGGKSAAEDSAAEHHSASQ